MNRSRRLWRQLAIDLAAVLILHAVLIRYLFAHNAVATIFASGDHIPRGVLALAMFFILIRLVVILALPGIVLARLASIAFTIHDESKCGRPPDASTPTQP
jgi:hypothetical protein